MHHKNLLLLLPVTLLSLAACEESREQASESTSSSPVTIVRTGTIESGKIDEASGMQTSFSDPSALFVHNDEGKPVIFAMGHDGSNLGKMSLVPAKNRDWEDITMVPVADGHWLVIGEIGDNRARREYITLYFAKEPQPDDDGRYRDMLPLEHRLDLTYPDGPRDTESMAYDPIGKRILLLSKRDKPSRVYAVGLETALQKNLAELQFLGEMVRLRPPTARDRAHWGGRTEWISQPTGFDISRDGSEAVIVTYRSLYRFRREGGEDWLQALQREPLEVVGPPAVQNEAVSYSADGQYVFVTTEKLPAPVYRVRFND